MLTFTYSELKYSVVELTGLPYMAIVLCKNRFFFSFLRKIQGMLVYFTYHYLIQGVAGSELIKGRITGRSRYYYKSKFENEGGTASADLGMGKRSVKRI